MAIKNSLLITNSGIQATINFTPYVVRIDHPHYGACQQAAKDALKAESEGEDASELWDEFIAAYNGSNNAAIKDVVKATGIVDGLVYDDGRILYNGRELHNAVIPVIRQYVNEGLPTKSLMNFLEKLMQNPSHRSVEQLWSFVERNGLSIDDDGNILFYKVVRNNYKDKHTGTYDNTPGGEPISCPRNEVSDDPDVACAAGFHVGGWDYSGPTGIFKTRSDDRVVICKVDPADVVSVPKDANAGKCRICKYTVVGDFVERLQPGHATVDGDDDAVHYDYSSDNNPFDGPRDSVDDELFDDEDEFDDEDDDENDDLDVIDSLAVGDVITFSYKGYNRRINVNEIDLNNGRINGILLKGDKSFPTGMLSRFRTEYRNFDVSDMEDVRKV